MNWYRNCELSDLNNIMAQAASRGFSKQATSGGHGFNDSAESDFQFGHTANLYDVQRYKLDGYVVKIALSETKHKNVLGIIVTHGSLGSITWTRYWYYDKNELGTAKNDLKKVCGIIQDNLNDFVKNETPSSLFWPHIREATADMAPEKLMHTNIPYFNYSRDLRYNPDWRTNIYGTRYPEYIEESYEKYFRKQNRSGKFPD